MRRINKYLWLIASAAFCSCQSYDADDHKFGNVVYLDVAETTDVQTATIKNTLDELDRTFSATLAYPSGGDVTVSIAVDPSLVDTYNARHNTSWPMLDAKYYSLSDERVTIPAGKTASDAVTLHLQELLGEGEDQTGALTLDATYLLPVTITNASVPTLDSSSTVWYVIKRSSNITTAAQLTDNWINFPTLDKDTEQAMALNNLTAVTYEALIYIDKFATSALNSAGVANPVSISTIMGVEDYLLLRIGDTNFYADQLQVDGSGVSLGKFPEKNKGKLLSLEEWYHVAFTYDLETGIACIYVNGQLQSQTQVAPTVKVINLGLRAIDPDPETDARQFFIGYSYDAFRQLCGDISEVRIWSVARTQADIWRDMYDVENPAEKPELRAYWKFNEGSGNIIKDWSQYGNDAVAHTDLKWNTSVEIPQLNKQE